MVVQGAGSMGLLHLLVLTAECPSVEVLVVDPVPERRKLAIRLGACGAATPDDALDRVKERSGSLGADAVFDTVGGAKPLNAALALSREGGAVVLFAHAEDGERADFTINDLFKHERRIMGSYSGGPREQARVFEHMAAGRLDPAPLVTHRLPLNRFEEGVHLARARKALKVVFIGSGYTP